VKGLKTVLSRSKTPFHQALQATILSAPRLVRVSHEPCLHSAREAKFWTMGKGVYGGGDAGMGIKMRSSVVASIVGLLLHFFIVFPFIVEACGMTDQGVSCLIE
jgi:hypothetical protein